MNTGLILTMCRGHPRLRLLYTECAFCEGVLLRTRESRHKHVQYRVSVSLVGVSACFANYKRRWKSAYFVIRLQRGGQTALRRSVENEEVHSLPLRCLVLLNRGRGFTDHI